MLGDEIVNNPHDFISIFNGEALPEINHEVLEVPGKFKTLVSAKSHKNKGSKRFMDTIELVEPDGDIVTKESVADIEYYVYTPDDDIIYDYDLLSILKYNKRVFHIHVVNEQPERIEDTIEVSDHPIKLLYRVFDEKGDGKF